MKDSEIEKVLAENLKKHRKAKKLTQEKLSELCNVSTETIKGIEIQRHWPSQKVLAAITSALDIGVYELFLPVPCSFKIEESIQRRIIDTAKKSFNDFLDTVKDKI